MIDKEEVFRFLDEIRRTGKINMFGAAEPIQEVYGVSRNEARALLKEWMETFSERTARISD